MAPFDSDNISAEAATHARRLSVAALMRREENRIQFRGVLRKSQCHTIATIEMKIKDDFALQIEPFLSEEQEANVLTLSSATMLTIQGHFIEQRGGGVQFFNS